MVQCCNTAEKTDTSLHSACRGALESSCPEAPWSQGSLSFAAVLRREFVVCLTMFPPVCVLSSYRVLRGVVFKAAIYL